VFGTRRTDQLDVNFDLNVNFDLKDQVLSRDERSGMVDAAAES